MGEWWYTLIMKILLSIFLILITFKLNAANILTSPIWEISDEWVCNRIYYFETRVDKLEQIPPELLDFHEDEPLTQFINFTNSTLTNSLGRKFIITDKKFLGGISFIFLKGVDKNSSYEDVLKVVSLSLLEDKYNSETGKYESDWIDGFFYNISRLDITRQTDTIISNVLRCNEVN